MYKNVTENKVIIILSTISMFFFTLIEKINFFLRVLIKEKNN